MRISEGNSGAPKIECLNPKRNTYVLRWNFIPKKDEDGNELDNNVTYCEEIIDHKPSLDEIQDIIISWYNSKIDETILSGFKYEGAIVWLTAENQRNYEAALNQAMRTNGKSLPEIYKFGTNAEPVYKQFNTIGELTEFCTQVYNFVKKTLNDGWAIKNSINWSDYELD